MNKKYFWIIGLVAILIIAGIALYLYPYYSIYSTGDKSPQVLTQISTQTSSMTQTQTQTQTQVKPVKTTTAPKTNTTLPSVDTTYAETLKKYEGRRMQVNASCQVTPFYVTYTNGTSIMLDNRSDSVKVVKFDSVAYSVPAFGFKIIKLTAKTVPHEISIDCGSKYNVGRVLIQK